MEITIKKLRGKRIVLLFWIFVNLITFKYNGGGKNYFGFPFTVFYFTVEKCEVCKEIYYDNIFLNLLLIILSFVLLYGLNVLLANRKKIE